MYVLNLFIAIAISIGIQFIYDNIKNIQLRKNILFAVIMTGTLYLFVYARFRGQFENLFPRSILILAFVQLALTLLFVFWTKIKVKTFVLLTVIASIYTIMVTNEQFFYEYGMRNKEYFVERFDDENYRVRQAINFIEE